MVRWVVWCLKSPWALQFDLKHERWTYYKRWRRRKRSSIPRLKQNKMVLNDSLTNYKLSSCRPLPWHQFQQYHLTWPCSTARGNAFFLHVYMVVVAIRGVLWCLQRPRVIPVHQNKNEAEWQPAVQARLSLGISLTLVPTVSVCQAVSCELFMNNFNWDEKQSLPSPSIPLMQFPLIGYQYARARCE